MAAVWRRSHNGWSYSGPVSQYWLIELNWLKMGENPLVSWSSCEFDLKEGRERGCDRWAGRRVCQISTLSIKSWCSKRLFVRGFESRMREVVVTMWDISKIFFQFMVGIFDCRGFLGKKIKRAFEISKNKCAFFLVFLYSRHKPTSI